MKRFATLFVLSALVTFGLAVFTGCESDGGGSVGVGVGVYYGTGFYDPWYYGTGYYPPGAIVTPPPENPDHPERPPKPEHPIVNPPPVPDRPTVQPQPARPTPAPRPMPSIPSRPRPAGRR